MWRKGGEEMAIVVRAIDMLAMAYKIPTIAQISSLRFYSPGGLRFAGRQVDRA